MWTPKSCVLGVLFFLTSVKYLKVVNPTIILECRVLPAVRIAPVEHGITVKHNVMSDYGDKAGQLSSKLPRHI